MATKEELFKNNPPKGSKVWSEKEDAQQAQKGTQQYVDGTAVSETPVPEEKKKEDKSEENGIEVSKIKKTNNVAEPVFYDVIKSKKNQNSPRYYQQVKDDFIVNYPLPTKKEEKKEEEKNERRQCAIKT